MQRVSDFFVTILTVVISFTAGVFTVQIVAPELLNRGDGPKLPAAVSASISAVGEFRGLDSVRRAAGRAQVLDAGEVRLVRFTAFEVSNGPHLAVWLTTDEGIIRTEDVRASEVTPLGPLVRPEGDQTYLVPEGLDLTDVGSVLIWSEELGVLYGVADLES